MGKLNFAGTQKDIPMPNTEEKINSKYPDLFGTEHGELLKTPHTSTCIELAEPSLATIHSDATSQPPIPFIHKEQYEPLILDQRTLNQEGLPDHNSTEDIPTVKYPQPQDSSVPQLAQNPVAKMEALQKPAQSLACLMTETPAGQYNLIVIPLNIFF